MRDNIEPALGRHFLAPLGDDRRLIGLHLAGDADNLVGDRQLQIQLDRHRLAQDPQIAVLNMPAVLAQMNRDGIRPAQLGKRGRRHRIGLIRLAACRSVATWSMLTPSSGMRLGVGGRGSEVGSRFRYKHNQFGHELRHAKAVAELSVCGADVFAASV